MADTPISFELDLSEVLGGSDFLVGAILAGTREGLKDIGEELLRLSQKEVPHDTGFLMQSGDVDDTGISKDVPEIVVGYNTPYAARMHEHPEYRFQKGRKGKYLEDPLKRNSRVFQDHLRDKVASRLV